MFLGEISNLLEQKLSPKLFKDNSEVYGIQYGSSDENKLIKKVLLTLDLSLNAIHYAVRKKVSLIISLHSLFDNAIRNLNPLIIKKLSLLTKYPTSIFILNSSYNIAEGGIIDTVIEKLYLKLEHTLNIRKGSIKEFPIARICSPQNYLNSDKIFSLEKLLMRIKSNLETSDIKYSGSLKEKINKICILKKNYFDYKIIEKAISEGVNCFITEGFEYLESNLARDLGISLIKLPIFRIKMIGLKKLYNILSLEFPYDEFYLYEPQDPISKY